MKIKEDLIFIDVLNGNDRIYDRIACEKIISEFKIKSKPLYGERNQPSSFEISFNNISHIINDLYIEDNKLKGDIILLDDELIKKYKNVTLGISFVSRCAGRENNTTKIVSIEDFITFDFTEHGSYDEYKKRELIIYREKKLKRILRKNEEI